MLDPGAGLTQVLADGTNSYLYGNGRLAQYQAAMQYFGADGLGSVRQLYDASGMVLATSRYDPYGSVLSQFGTATSAFGFTGEQYDAATGLEYLRARYYSPAQGRFITRDEWEGNFTAPLSLNRWNYAQPNPVVITDPSGRAGPLIVAVVFVLGLGVAGVVWLANPPPVSAPGPNGIPPGAAQDRDYGDRAFLDTAPGTGDVSDIYAFFTGETFFAHEPQERWISGICLLPYVTAGIVKSVTRGGSRLARFKGASEPVLRGVQSLIDRLDNPKYPARFKKGLEAQLQRAEYYFKQRTLQAVEVTEHGNRYDIVLKTDQIIEVKYWTEDYSEKHIPAILEQVKKYQASGKPVKLDLGQTKTDPITDEFIKKLLNEAKKSNVPLKPEDIEKFQLD